MPPSERLAEITRRLRGIGGSTSLGFGAERTRSLPDALAKVLEEYLDRPRPQPSAGGAAEHARGAGADRRWLDAAPDRRRGAQRQRPPNGHSNGQRTATPTATSALHGPRITGDLCPDCGTALVYEEGCSKCMGCGYARC